MSFGATLVTSLAWAIPVKVDLLGASIEAYFELLPVIYALRTCHRYGGDVPITRLPIELIGCIENYLLIQERDSVHREWEMDLRCFESRCRVDDHAGSDEKRKVIDDLVRVGSVEGLDDAETTGAIDEYWEEYCDDIHTERQRDWDFRTYIDPKQDAGNQSIFCTHAVEFKKHFGLEIWLSHARWAKEIDNFVWEDKHTTLAYLRLPSLPPCQIEVGRSNLELQTEEGVVAGYGLQIWPQDPISKATKAKFHRAMRILGLSPFQHDFQKDHVIGKSLQNSSQTSPDDQDWPRLVVLIKTHLDSLQI